MSDNYNNARSGEAHNRIFFHLQRNADAYIHVESWHGSHTMTYTSYASWISAIQKVLNKNYLIDNFPEYYMSISDTDMDDDDVHDMYDSSKIDLLECLYKLYPALKYQQSGSGEDLSELVLTRIINPLILDKPFVEGWFEEGYY